MEKNYSKWKNLNINDWKLNSCKKIGKRFHDTEFVNGFFTMTPKAQQQRQKRQMELSQTLKLQIIGNNQQNEKQEKTDIANHYLLPGKGLIPKI